MVIKFGPAGLGPAKTAEDVLENLHRAGLRACEIAFTYSVYLKPDDALRIGKKAEKLEIELSVHASYYCNLNSDEKSKVEATKKRILEAAEIADILKAKVVVFHPGYYGKNKEGAYENIKKGILDIQKKMKEKGLKVKLAPETTGKVNVFGSIDEISKLVKETGCSFCIDFAHVLAREKKIDFDKIKKAFPQKEWHCHFSGIIYGEKGERKHRSTEKDEWVNLLKNLPKNKKIRILNESPTMIDDSIEGLEIYEKIN